MLIIVFYVLLLFYVSLIFYYFTGWNKLKEYKYEEINKLSKISVIISARNEAVQIEKTLQCIIDQDYHDELFEIIVVDDYSSDRTPEIVNSISAKNLKLLELKNYPGKHTPSKPNKKFAISTGVKEAMGKLIVVTDADCSMSKQWLRSIASFYTETKAGFIAGPVLLQGSGSFLSEFQKLDMISLTGIAGGAIAHNNPTLCNAANMAFEKDLFLQTDGFGVYEDKPSGDDIFLMHKFHLETGRKVAYLKDIEATVISNTIDTFSEFLEQRKRWVSKSTSYGKKSVTFTLFLSYLFHLSLAISLFMSIGGNSQMQIYLAVAISLKMFVDYIFLYTVSRFFRRTQSLYLFLPIQIFHIVYVIFIGILGMFFDYKWKDRTVSKSIRIRSGKVER